MWARDYFRFSFLPAGAAGVEPILSLFSLISLMLIMIYEPQWVQTEFVYILMGFLALSCLQLAYYQILVERSNGKRLGFGVYLSQLWSVTWIHGGGFGAGLLWLTFADPAP